MGPSSRRTPSGAYLRASLTLKISLVSSLDDASLTLRMISFSFWRDHVLQDMHQRLQPWIVESDENEDSGNVLFYSLVSGYYYLIHIEEFKGRRVAGYGAGLLIGIDKDDDLSALLVNPLTGENTELPRLPLPEHFRGTSTYGFATNPDMMGENQVVVVLYNQPTQEARSKVALWRHGDSAGWATMPSEAFWMRMPQLRGRLLTHGPQVVEGEEAAAAAAANGYDHRDMGDGWLPGMQGKHIIEHEGHVRVLVRLEQPEIVGDAVLEGPVRPGDPLPRLSFELRNTLAADGEAIDWADAPELHDKIIFQSQGNSCYVLPESDHFIGIRKNFIYFFSWQRQEVAVGDGGGASGGNPFEFQRSVVLIYLMSCHVMRLMLCEPMFGFISFYASAYLS